MPKFLNSDDVDLILEACFDPSSAIICERREIIVAWATWFWLSRVMSVPTPDAVLLDNDPLMLNLWKMRAEDKDVQLGCFDSIENFNQHLETLPKSIKIYLDVNLGSDLDGLDLARDLDRRGFENIWLTTGYDFDVVDELDFLKGVLGKSPPF